MLLNIKKITLLLVIITLNVLGMRYNPFEAVLYAWKHYKNPNPDYHYYTKLVKYFDKTQEKWKKKIVLVDCANFVSQCLIAGFNGAFAKGPRFSWEEWENYKQTQNHKNAKYRFDKKGSLSWCTEPRDFLVNNLDCESYVWDANNRPKTPPSYVRAGDVAFYYSCDGGHPAHAMIIVGTENDRITYGAHSTDRINGNLLKWERTKKLEIVHIPDLVLTCRNFKYNYASDSTFQTDYWVRHKSICCWHENLDGEVPWTSNTTPYMCLNWQETRGTTWDTLISPRMNFVGRCSVMLIQACTSNLIHGSNKTIKIKGSTDDGATWTYDIGTDTTQRANIFWANNQRNVRIAWIYVGQVQGGRFWCIDDVGIWAKPSRDIDISVPEIRCPKGRGGITTIITQGKIIKPAAFVWNFGKEDESLSVTFKIGSSYTDTKWLKLCALNDTLLEFSAWTATPGNYTATCYSNFTDKLSDNFFNEVLDNTLKNIINYIGV